MQMTLYFAIRHFSCPDLVFKTLPHWPPDGFIMDGFAMLIVSVTFGLLNLHTWVWLLQLSQWLLIWQLILRELRIYHTKYLQLDWCKQFDNLLTRMAAYITSDSLEDESMLSFDTDMSFRVCYMQLPVIFVEKSHCSLGILCLQSTKSVQRMGLIENLSNGNRHSMT